MGVEWIDHRSRIIDKRAEKSLECGRQTFLVLSEGRVCKGSNNVDARPCFPNHSHGVGGETEKRVVVVVGAAYNHIYRITSQWHCTQLTQ